MFGSTWGNQNNQQQPQQSAFGQPSAFGNTTTSAFGSTNPLAPAQQPQQANPMFGNLQAPTNPAPSTGFGAFGTANNNTTSAFGAPKPTTGFSAFSGGTSAFGGGSAFGQPSTTNAGTTSVFGQPSTSSTPSAFGGGSVFGATKPATSAFGSTTTAATTVTNGTAGTPYAAYDEKETNSTLMLHYQAISCIPAYRNYSFEELRLQDYTQNRKTAPAAGFGGASAFGTAQPTATGAFGAQTNQPATTTGSAWGGGQQTGNGWGGSGWGSNTQTSTTQPTNTWGSGTTTFGQQPQQQTQPAQPSAFGAFSQQQQQQQQQPQQQTGGIFGNSAFGTAPKPAFSAFGNTATGTGTFGPTTFGQAAQPQPQQQQHQPQPQQQQQQQQGSSIFGTTQPATTNTFGTFGNTQNKPLFGNANTTATQPAATNTFGIFGNQANQQTQQQPQQPQQTSIFGNAGGGLFGNANAQQPQQNATQPATSLFGNTQAATGTGAGIFGNTGGIFGGTNNQQQQGTQPAQANSLFAPKPAGSIFSNQSTFGQQTNTNNATQPQTGLFGNMQNNNNQSTIGGGSIFGLKPATPAIGTSTSGQTGNLFGSTLGGSTNNFGTSTVQPLTASIAEPIGTNLPIFSMLPPGPRSVNVEQSQPKKKTGFFVDVPTRSPVPRVQLGGFNPASSKLRGFGTSTSSVNSNNGLSSLNFGSGKPNALSLNKSFDAHGSVGPDAMLGRSSSPALGSGPRQSVKKVIMEKKVEPTELFIKTGSPGNLRGGKITFSPALSVAAREKDAAALSSHNLDSPTPTSKTLNRSPKRFTANNVPDIAHSTTEATADTVLQEGDYYIKPDLVTLKKASYDQLSSYEGLIVGRVGYGEVHFLEPVDLTGLPKLGALLGDVVRFDDKECSVYPDSEDVDKPPPGSGLNVRARLVLERCWAIDKATREPIKDTSHPMAVKHLKRLRGMRDTHFENFEMDSGKWTFTVDHF